MDILIIIALIAAGLLLFLAEVFFVPGLSLAGIASAGCLIYANFYAFSTLGPTPGLVTLIVSLCSYVALLVWFVRSKYIDRLALKRNIDSTIGTPARQEVKVGDTGTAVTRLALIGYADFDGRVIEVKSADGFLNERTPVTVTRIAEGTVMVCRTQSGDKPE